MIYMVLADYPLQDCRNNLKFHRNIVNSHVIAKNSSVLGISSQLLS